MLGNLEFHRKNLIVFISFNLTQDQFKIELFEERNLRHETARAK